ncbi:MAG: hypothetical protein J3Q66DRAFT_399963 [Benniella sp.]|nr:MAG: hypothetical protein J3Q66DRAFT_399963 [Benniella sp.]
MPSKQRICGQPTIKIFQDIFKFFNVKLEPGHKFQKTYPASESITRSSLQAVGRPHSWSNMLALIGWMMDVILSSSLNSTASDSGKLFSVEVKNKG